MNYPQLLTKSALVAKTAVRTFIETTFRYLTYIGLIPKHSQKKGISANLTVKNETEGIEHISHTISGFADEIVIVGAPIDETHKIIEEVELMHRGNGMMIQKDFLSILIKSYKCKGGM